MLEVIDRVAQTLTPKITLMIGTITQNKTGFSLAKERAGPGWLGSCQQDGCEEVAMLTQNVPKRFVGLDIHKNYFVVAGVDKKLNQVLGLYEAPDCVSVGIFSLLFLQGQ